MIEMYIFRVFFVFLDYIYLVFKILDKDEVNENLNLFKSENVYFYKI